MKLHGHNFRCRIVKWFVLLVEDLLSYISVHISPITVYSCKLFFDAGTLVDWL